MIDFKKAFHSIDRKKMLKILDAYRILPEIVSAIRVMYKNTIAIVRILKSILTFFR